MTMNLLFTCTLTGGIFYFISRLLSLPFGDRLSPGWQRLRCRVSLFLFLLPAAPALAGLGRLLPAGFSGEEALEFLAEIPSPLQEQIAAGDVMFSTPLLLPTLLRFLPLVWLIGVLLSGLHQLAVIRRFRRALLCPAVPVTDPEALDSLRQLKKELEIRKNIILLQNPALSTSLLTGLFTPRLILSGAALSGRELELVLRHELTHLRRRDLWWKSAALLCRLLHWFNPLAHLLAQDLSVCLETCCDRDMAAAMSYEDRRLYGRVILESFCAPPVPGSFFASLCGDSKSIKRRLSVMLNPNRPSRAVRCCSALLLAAALAGGCAVGALAYEAPDQNRPSRFEAPEPVQSEPVQPVPDEPDIPLPQVAEEKPVFSDGDIGFIWPTTGGYVSAGVNSYPGHTGMDIVGNGGEPIYAAAAGTVTLAKESHVGYGNYIVVDHGGGYQTLYAHNRKNLVEVGDTVEQGQKIGIVGRSGNTTGENLHFELRCQDKILDPQDFLEVPA